MQCNIFSSKNCRISMYIIRVNKMLKMNPLWLRLIPSLMNRAITKEFSNRTLHSLSIISANAMDKLVNFNSIQPSYNIIRQKSKMKSDDDSDELDFFDSDTSLSKDSKVVKFSTTTLRTDAVLKSALGIARNKIEQFFYESKIRVNGRKILKKSAPVRIDYEIDVIKSVSPKNPDHLYIARVEILNITAKEDNISFTVRRFKNLLIENYEDDPYKPGSAEQNE